MDQGSTCLTSFDFNYFFRGLIFKYNCTGVLGFQCADFEETKHSVHNVQLVNSSTKCVYPLNKVSQKPNFKNFDEVQFIKISSVNYDFGG